MNPVPPPAPPDAPHPSSSLELLGRCAADLMLATGKHAGLLLDEARFRLMSAVRTAMFDLALCVAAILTCVGGYILLVREAALWLGSCLGHPGPGLVSMIVYALATVLPLVLLKLYWRISARASLTALETRHRT